MESYVVSCKYAEPQFPPCEEDYSNFSDQGGYYNNPQESGSYGGGYQTMQPPPPPYAPQQTGYHSLQEHRREDGEERSRQRAPFAGYRGTDAAEKQGYPAVDLQCQAWMTCAKSAQVQRKEACQAKDKPPIVVYPWMKKVHVAQGAFQLSISFLHYLSLFEHHRFLFISFYLHCPLLFALLIYSRS